MKESYIYILTNKYRTTFYIGITANISKRMIEHKEKTASKFTERYNTSDLIYFEKFTDINQAISREKQLKNWRKEWKINLIKKLNPTLDTLNY
ncbi:GIY-YIG nuclease family protein [Tenacibaculum piscium]|uniref:GIY-YIG nuclease family protein n=1 Tax=Tenacibaculum piscium TaxID=1458515 RepID=UPI001EFA335C|nr:GIY-YIG nuclease family protein [Tenacibaculum piscium]MCG8183925.1 GIY-YIG nuclease family protein [Tenacibaculum piscium]MCG8205149.1 GIY-YIG nuclease family protein [Tenacibaculum piscium]